MGELIEKNWTGETFFLSTWLAAQRGQLPDSRVSVSMLPVYAFSKNSNYQGNTIFFQIFSKFFIGMEDLFVILISDTWHWYKKMFTQLKLQMKQKQQKRNSLTNPFEFGFFTIHIWTLLVRMLV